MHAEEPSAQIEVAPEEPSRLRRRWAILRLALIGFGAVIVWLVTWFAITGAMGLQTMTLNLILPSAGVLLFGLIVLRQEQTWVWPVKRMAHLLPRIHAGDLPIDALNEIEGGSKELAAHLRALLHDLRSQKTRVAEINAEMNQRVANRTDALERTIGSLRQQATRDPLTTLYNRRMLDQFLPGEIDKCRAERTNLAVLMIDVDHFKNLNDTLGHASGDELLRNISQLIRSTIPENAAAFRNGGDEFVVVLPGCNEVEASAFATRIKSLVSALAKTLRITPSPGVSIGISMLWQHRDATAHTLLEQADKRLYEHKSARKPMARAG